MKRLTKIEERVLNRIQKDWLITETPFKTLSEELDMDEENLIKVIYSLKKEKLIRDISAIFNAAALGYESALITFSVDDKDIAKAAEVINAHHGVSHNYLRDHRYNIWFTLTMKKKYSIENEAGILADRCNVKDFLILRNEKLIKIGVMFHVGEQDDISEDSYNEYVSQSTGQYMSGELSKEAEKAVYILQTDLPLTKRPFKYLSEKFSLGINEKKVVEFGEAFKKEGIMRRYSAAIKHNKAGYVFNAMTVWKYPNVNDDVIKIFSDVPNISHLYFRTVYPGKWEHGLFAMIHAKTDEELKSIINTIETKTGIKDYLVLNSLKEFKKSRVKYFEEEFKK